MRALAGPLLSVALAIGAAAVVFHTAAPLRADALIADLSHRVVKITTGFTGAQVLVFGTKTGPGDVIVVVRGPEEAVDVRRKDRVAGIWINQMRVGLERVPSFFWVAASRTLAAEELDPLLRRYGIALDVLDPRPTEPQSSDRLREFREGFFRAKAREGLYAPEVARVAFIGDTLFRATLPLPANVPTGSYLVETYNVEKGHVVSAAASALVVEKAGFGAEVARFAHRDAALYGLIAVLVAALAGWGAAELFRRV